MGQETLFPISNIEKNLANKKLNLIRYFLGIFLIKNLINNFIFIRSATRQVYCFWQDKYFLNRLIKLSSALLQKSDPLYEQHKLKSCMRRLCLNTKNALE